jgi:hypothetical protein
MYPTKEEIMKLPSPNFPPELIARVKEWKKAHYKGWKKDPIKITRLLLLIHTLATGIQPQVSDRYCYIDNESEDKLSIIELDGDHPSILSTLHELGHHFFGSSELEACRWSIWLFKTCFPKSFEKLKWDGHMLKQDEGQDIS